MAKIQTNLLTDIQIRKWIRAGSPVAKSDGGRLTFTLSAAGAATWVLRFRHGGRRAHLSKRSLHIVATGKHRHAGGIAALKFGDEFRWRCE
jgi:hypothetical protein